MPSSVILIALHPCYLMSSQQVKGPAYQGWAALDRVKVPVRLWPQPVP